jgi:dolichyl-phosphate beta-glucosyltransferase
VTDDHIDRSGDTDAAVELSIVVPAFNEADRLADGFRRFDAAVADGAIDVERTELILVDDGSTDETVSAATKVLAPFPHHRVVSHAVNQGKGAAVRTGVRSARGGVIAYMDADMAIDPRAVPLLLDALADHDVAVGSRALHESMVETTYAVRTLMGHVFNRIVTAGTGLGLRDTQCGFKAFRAPVARLLFGLVQIDRFAFDVDLLLRAHRLGLHITEVPVQWKYVDGSTIQPVSDSLTMVADTFRTRLGLLPPPVVPAVAVRGPADDPSALAESVARALAGCDHDPSACVVAGDPGTDVTVLLPMLSAQEVAECWSALRAELAPRDVSRRMVTFGQLESMRPLGGRVWSPT